MVCCELWCFEISAILAGAISEVQLGINSVMIQLLANTFQVRFAHACPYKSAVHAVPR